jgi:hypothetical protein
MSRRQEDRDPAIVPGLGGSDVADGGSPADVGRRVRALALGGTVERPVKILRERLLDLETFSGPRMVECQPAGV